MFVSPLQLSVFDSWYVIATIYLVQVSLGLLELSSDQDLTESVQRSTFPATPALQSENAPPLEKDELSALKASLRKVKIFTDYVSTRRAKKACREEEGSEGRCSAKSEEGEYAYPFDSESADDFDEGESEEGKEDPTVRKSFSYGTLAYANFAGGTFYSNSKISDQDEDWIYYSNRKSDVGCSSTEDPVPVIPEPSITQNTKRSILPWRKRKLSFRSPKAKGEPLLKKDYGEEGGDDIDFDRRQLSSDESPSSWVRKLATFFWRLFEIGFMEILDRYPLYSLIYLILNLIRIIFSPQLLLNMLANDYDEARDNFLILYEICLMPFNC